MIVIRIILLIPIFYFIHLFITILQLISTPIVLPYHHDHYFNFMFLKYLIAIAIEVPQN